MGVWVASTLGLAALEGQLGLCLNQGEAWTHCLCAKLGCVWVVTVEVVL